MLQRLIELANYMSLVYTDRIVEQIELATPEWVWWWNNQRLHSELGYRTPAEVEATYYADHDTPETATAALDRHEEQTVRITWINDPAERAKQQLAT